MTFHIEWDQDAIKQVLRDRPIQTYLAQIGNSIADEIENLSGEDRTGDNSPRHIKSSKRALNAGRGYEHYQDGIRVVIGMNAGMAAVYVYGTRHEMTQEFGWRNYYTGEKYSGRFFMTRALAAHRID